MSQRRLWLLLTLMGLSSLLFVAAWAVRLHDTHRLDREICQRVENTNTAVRLVLAIRLRDPSTPEPVKVVFRQTIRTYLQPVDCAHL